MGLGIGAGGIVGIAFETTPGTYVAPTKFFPIKSESLAWKQETIWRRVIRGSVDPLGAVAGNGEFTGDIDMEFLEDVHPYFAYASRAGVVKAGAGPNYTYTIKGTHTGAQATAETLSITVVRNGECFGYTNCVVVKQEFTVDNGMLAAKYTIMGSDEAEESVPVPSFTATQPFGAGTYDIEIPTATPVTDTDNMTLSIDDGGENQYRLRSTGRGPAFAKFGERTVELSVDRDFQDRTDYDSFKALTSQSITLKATKGANNYVHFKVPAAITDTYEVALGGVGDLIRASTKYQGVYHAGTTAGYEIVVATQENIV